MKLSDVSMQSIKEWIAANPARKQALFNANPSYVFFKTLPADNNGPLGAMGVPLLGGYSVAVDPRYIPLGAPVYLSTTWPLDGAPRPLNRLVRCAGRLFLWLWYRSRPVRRPHETEWPPVAALAAWHAACGQPLIYPIKPAPPCRRGCLEGLCNA